MKFRLLIPSGLGRSKYLAETVLPFVAPGESGQIGSSLPQEQGSIGPTL